MHHAVLHAAEDAAHLKRNNDRLAEPCLNSLHRMYSGAATATDSASNRQKLLCSARWDCVLPCFCAISQSLPLLQTIQESAQLGAVLVIGNCALRQHTAAACTHLSMRPQMCCNAVGIAWNNMSHAHLLCLMHPLPQLGSRQAGCSLSSRHVNVVNRFQDA